MLPPIKRSLAEVTPRAAAVLAPDEQIYEKADPGNPMWLSSFSMLENAIGRLNDGQGKVDLTTMARVIHNYNMVYGLELPMYVRLGSVVSLTSIVFFGVISCLFR